jgi:hypothetical protein
MKLPAQDNPKIEYAVPLLEGAEMGPKRMKVLQPGTDWY